jgi:hypothetical protein
MTVEEARRKVGLLRKISVDNGAAAAEAETARRLQAALIERYAIKARAKVPFTSSTPAPTLTWVYWQELLQEFGLRLDQFGYRGSASVGSKKVYIRLDKNQWWIEETLPKGRQTTTRNWGVESLRQYLKEHAPRTYTFFGR